MLPESGPRPRQPIFTDREVVALHGLTEMYLLCPPEERKALLDEFDRFGWAEPRLCGAVMIALEVVEAQQERERAETRAWLDANKPTKTRMDECWRRGSDRLLAALDLPDPARPERAKRVEGEDQ